MRGVVCVEIVVEIALTLGAFVVAILSIVNLSISSEDDIDEFADWIDSLESGDELANWLESLAAAYCGLIDLVIVLAMTRQSDAGSLANAEVQAMMCAHSDRIELCGSWATIQTTTFIRSVLPVLVTLVASQLVAEGETDKEALIIACSVVVALGSVWIMCFGEGSCLQSGEELTQAYAKRTRIYNLVCRDGVCFLLTVVIFKDFLLSLSFGLLSLEDGTHLLLDLLCLQA